MLNKNSVNKDIVKSPKPEAAEPDTILKNGNLSN